MTQTPADPMMPRGKRPRLEPPQVPAQQALLAPAPGGQTKVKRWPAAVGAGVLGLFIGVGLGASSPRAPRFKPVSQLGELAFVATRCP